MKYQQVKTEWGVSGEGGRGRKRATDYQRKRDGAQAEAKWRGLEMAVSEKGYLSIFSKTNQQNQKAVNHLGWISNSFISVVLDIRSHVDLSHNSIVRSYSV